ncbi:hypothetical protein OFC55_36885, partial [Escherichia coli]|nr:hypothetical protein [Escherichia coli]
LNSISTGPFGGVFQFDTASPSVAINLNQFGSGTNFYLGTQVTATYTGCLGANSDSIYRIGTNNLAATVRTLGANNILTGASAVTVG